MADYYPLIARALEGLPTRSPEARRTVYDRARAALTGQLGALQPALGHAEIAREQAALADAIARAEAAFAEPAPEATVEPERPAEARRPRVEKPPAIKRGGRRTHPLLVATALLAILLPIAVAAWLWRDPPRTGGTPPPTVAEAEPPPVVAAPSDPKFADRISGGASRPAAATPPVVTAAAPPAVPVPRIDPAPPAASRAADPGAPTSPAQPEIAVAQRAIFIEENTADPQGPKIVGGRSVWQLDAVPGGQGRPLETVVRLNVDVPEENLSFAAVLRRNSDPTLPASHTLEIVFRAGAADPGRAVRDVGLPALRPDEASRGVPVAGLSVPVQENAFLVGLSRPDVERNTELLLRRSWIEIPIRMASGARANILVEKGLSGERIVAEAFRQWEGSR